MPKCGYRLEAEYAAERVDAIKDVTSPTGWRIPDTRKLFELWEAMGLDVRRTNVGPGRFLDAPWCRICEIDWNARLGVGGLGAPRCDPAKHTNYYDRLERSRKDN